jgi:hemoglobin
VVHAFYEKVRHHPRLQARFARISDLPAHEAQVIEFWWIAMGGRSHGPRVHEMVARHRTLGLTEEDFACWLAVFDKTLQEILPADLAAQWKQMAEGIADRLKAKLL